jgi:hypothetical protein
VAVTVVNGLVAYLCGGGAVFVLRGASDPDVATTAMRAAARALQQIPHPDEPDDALPNFVSAVTAEPDGPSFWIDVKDMLDQNDLLAQEVVDSLVTALDAAGADGQLGFTSAAVATEAEATSAREVAVSSKEVPDWLPVPNGVVEIDAALVGQVGRVRFWVKGDTDQLVASYSELLAEAGFVLGDLDSADQPHFTAYQRYFSGRGANFSLGVGAVSRPSRSDASIREVAVEIRFLRA